MRQFKKNHSCLRLRSVSIIISLHSIEIFSVEGRNLFLGKVVEQGTEIWETWDHKINVKFNYKKHFSLKSRYKSRLTAGPYPPAKLHGQDTDRGQCSCLRTHRYGHCTYLCSALLCHVWQGWNPACCSPSSLQTWSGQHPPCPLHPIHRSLNSDSVM